MLWLDIRKPLLICILHIKAYFILLKHLDLLQPFNILEFKYLFKYC